MQNDFDLEAPCVGKTPEEYYGYEDEELDGEIHDFDEDYEYESRRDMELEDEIY